MDPVNVVLFIFGISIGSFLNVLIDRLPMGQDVVKGRSHCDYCHRHLSWFELLPIFSWIIQRGTSRCCHKKLSVQYPLIELLIGLGFVMIYRLGGSALSLPFFAYLVLFCSSIGIVVADYKTEYIPELFLYAASFAVIALLSPLLFSCIEGSASSCAFVLHSYLIPSGIGTGFFFLLWLFSKGRAMGDGDIYLSGIIGMALGYPRLIIAYYAAFLTGATAGVILILVRKKRMKSHMPFGPFMILGLGIASMYGSEILNLWSKLW
ncbi:MAG: prepilin peptidase [Microgenomates group bacterium]